MNNNHESSDQILTLTELGLSVTQARVYLSIAKSSSLTAQAIAGLSSVSRPDVYRVLKQLQDQGLVEKRIAKPEEFQAIPIEECLSILLKRRTDKTQDLQTRGRKLVEDLKEKTEHTNSNLNCEFLLFSSNKETAFARSEKLLEGTHKSLYILGFTKSMSFWLAERSIDAENALAKNLDCRLILSNSSNSKLFEPLRAFQTYPNFKVKTLAKLPKASFSIWDKREIVIATSALETPFPNSMLWSNNQNLISLCLDHFNNLWSKAKERK